MIMLHAKSPGEQKQLVIKYRCLALLKLHGKCTFDLAKNGLIMYKYQTVQISHRKRVPQMVRSMEEKTLFLKSACYFGYPVCLINER